METIMLDKLISGTPFDVAVICAGASGTLVAAQFEKFAPTYARMILIGEQPRPARGLAYDTAYEAPLLNVPAGNMSAYPDDPEHFTRWLAKHLPGSSAVTFVHRKLYGAYLLNEFMKLRKYSKKIEYLNHKVIESIHQNDLWSIHLENGVVIQARSVVLALGNLLLPHAPIDFRPIKPYYQPDPWSNKLAEGLPIDAPVLLIGTGLTMVDVALSLREAGHRGTIHAISRHGRLYQAHRPYQPRHLSEIPAAASTPPGAMHWIRNEVRDAEQSSNNWRAVIDSLRPHTAAIWQKWNLQQRKSFLRHARNIWDVHRHRMAPEIADQLSTLLEAHELIIHRGRLVSAYTKQGMAVIEWEDRETNESNTLHVARVINCTGPSRNLAKSKSPLVLSLLSSGWITPDPLELGLFTDGDGRLLDRNGNASPHLFTLGPLRVADLWESIAIPEIRCQAKILAELLISEIAEARIRPSHLGAMPSGKARVCKLLTRGFDSRGRL
jgi:uncharacterized NAD(P)/FAD-binding protein YdhS